MCDEFDEVPGVMGGALKEVKKSSYYVWFLGAQEAKGLRGEEYVRPIVRSLVQKEREVEPFKVTLQVSAKGLKIVQNVPGCKDLLKHFIPHHAVTCVVQEAPPNDDIVSCILLIYNPNTRCPVHVHCYRCDSVETAAVLRAQLETLIERPDNQKKFTEIETRLQAKGLLGRRAPPGGSDGRSSSARESESSGSSSGGDGQTRPGSLYDSLAAELREKLHGIKGPLLLPPRDYDTVHRARGNLTGIELRRCRNAAIVGAAEQASPPVSSGGSSGIGSDDAPPSPKEYRVKKIEQPPRRTHLRKTTAAYPPEPHTSEEEDEWRSPPSWSPPRVAAAPPAPDLSLPRPRRVHQPQPLDEPAIKPHRVPSFVDKQEAPRRRIRDPELRQRSPSPLSPRERFQDAKEKFHRMEREKIDELQLRLERRRQETAAANVAAAMSSGRAPPTEARGQFRAVPVRNLSDDELDDEEGFEPVLIPLKETEEQRRRTSHELAKEFNNKRRSYHQLSTPSSGYHELAEHERFPGLDRQTARLNHHFQERYRHSYAEPEYFNRQQGMRRYTPNGAPPLSNRLAGIHPY